MIVFLPYDNTILYCNMMGLILEGDRFLPYDNIILCRDIESCIFGATAFFSSSHTHIL